MRKGHKAELCKVFEEKVQCGAELPDERLKFVIDGGFLLHRVIWSVPSTYRAICERYVAHVINKYSQNATVVFDGYESSTNTKDAEHRRRAARGLVQMLLLKRQWCAWLNQWISLRIQGTRSN